MSMTLSCIQVYSNARYRCNNRNDQCTICPATIKKLSKTDAISQTHTWLIVSAIYLRTISHAERGRVWIIMSVAYRFVISSLGSNNVEHHKKRNIFAQSSLHRKWEQMELPNSVYHARCKYQIQKWLRMTANRGVQTILHRFWGEGRCQKFNQEHSIQHPHQNQFKDM